MLHYHISLCVCFKYFLRQVLKSKCKRLNSNRLHLIVFKKNNDCFAYYCVAGAQKGICCIEDTK